MTPQDFKALLDALNRIAEAIEALKESDAREVVNRFAVVFRELKKLEIACDRKDQPELAGEVVKIIKTYAKIASEVLNESNQNQKQIQS